MTHYLIFDIETAPLPVADLAGPLHEAGLDVEPQPPLEPDYEATFKGGNLKDPEKLAAKKAEHTSKLRAAWQAEIASGSWQTDWQTKRDAFIQNCCLSPFTGRIVGLGWRWVATDGRPGPVETVIGHDERAILTHFLALLESAGPSAPVVVGHNVKDFDLPFIMTRLWANGIEIPKLRAARGSAVQMDGLYDLYVGKGARYGDWVIDMMEHAACGRRGRDGMIGLGRLAGLLNIPIEKNGNGADFWKLLETAANGMAGGDVVATEAMTTARNYLANDVQLTWMVAVGLGVVPAPDANVEDRDEVTADPVMEVAKGAFAELEKK